MRRASIALAPGALALALGCDAPSALGERCASHDDCEPGLLCSNGAEDPATGGTLGVCVLPEALRDAGADAFARADAPVPPDTLASLAGADAGADAPGDAPDEMSAPCLCDAPPGPDVGADPPDAAADL